MSPIPENGSRVLVRLAAALDIFAREESYRSFFFALWLHFRNPGLLQFSLPFQILNRNFSQTSLDFLNYFFRIDSI
jgi:hypothetical protein